MTENIPFPLISEIRDMNLYETNDDIFLSLKITILTHLLTYQIFEAQM